MKSELILIYVVFAIGFACIFIGSLWYILRWFMSARVILGGLIGMLLGASAFRFLPDLLRLVAQQQGLNLPDEDPAQKIALWTISTAIGATIGAIIGSLAMATSTIVRALSQPVTVAPGKQ